MNCTFCGQALTGKLDTFGDVGEEMCRSCWCNPLLWADLYGPWDAIELACSVCHKPMVLMGNPENAVTWTCPNCHTHHFHDYQHIGSDPDAWMDAIPTKHETQ